MLKIYIFINTGITTYIGGFGVNTIFTITKYSYQDKDNYCFLPGIFCHLATSEDMLLNILKTYMQFENVKDLWMNDDPNKSEVFYVTYTDEFEKNFYHGYQITVMDTKTNKNNMLTKQNYPELWDKIYTMVNEMNELADK